MKKVEIEWSTINGDVVRLYEIVEKHIAFIAATKCKSDYYVVVGLKDHSVIPFNRNFSIDDIEFILVDDLDTDTYVFYGDISSANINALKYDANYVREVPDE